MATTTFIERSLHDLKPYEGNSRTHTQEQIAQVAKSIKEFGFLNPIIVDEQSTIIAGHARLEAAKLLGLSHVPTIEASGLTDAQQRAYVIADNRLALDADWDEEQLAHEIAALKEEDFDLSFTGFTPDELASIIDPALTSGASYDEASPGALAEKYIMTPFSVFDSRQSAWIERKQLWKTLGLDVGAGRGEEATDTGNKKFGKVFADSLAIGGVSATSLFDPVLTELLIQWFCPSDGLIIDPFAGGPPRGVVSAILGRRYIGTDLRKEQIDANEECWKGICRNTSVEKAPRWIVDNGSNLAKHCPEPADFILSCPPYADLEVYSDDPNDLSTMAYDDFIPSYREIIKQAVAQLKDNRFIAWVVTEIRDKNGRYRGFVPDTIQAFEDAGAVFYNDCVLINCIGSAALRVRRAFEPARKIVRLHQNVLIFVKGDARSAVKELSSVEDYFRDVTPSSDESL